MGQTKPVGCTLLASGCQKKILVDMNTLSEETGRGLQKASTVAIIVHGVGDHSPSEILESAHNYVSHQSLGWSLQTGLFQNR
jgi:hypothetical protein